MIDQDQGSFLEACGSSGKLILGVEKLGRSSLSWHAFDRPFVVVGRDRRADLCLDDASVSRRHAYFQIIAGRLFCMDLQSRTGTLWGDRLDCRGWVHPESGVTIGPFRLGRPEPNLAPLSSEPERGLPAAIPMSRSFHQPDLPEATLEMLGSRLGSSWTVDRSLVLIGTASSCKVRLQGGGVSRHHASLLRTPGGLFVVDLLSREGLIHNGQRVRYARIGDEDELILGRYRLQVRCPKSRGRLGVCSASMPRDSASQAFPQSLSTPGSAIVVKNHDDAERIFPLAEQDPMSLFRSLLDEFAQGQSRSADRLHEALLATMRSFLTIHGEQMDLIRTELDFIKQLNLEQQTLRAQVSIRDVPASPTPILRLVAGEGVSPDLRLPAKRKRPAQNSRSLALASQADLISGERDRITSTCPGPPVQLHEQIMNRIAAIQDERQGSWQRLIRSLIP